MQVARRWNFGLGTVFSLIIIYFIYLYSKDKGWAVLAFLSKWYLIIVGGIIALSLGMIVLVLLFSLIMFLIALLKINKLNKKGKKEKSKNYIEAEYEVKE
ncbi:MAG TPA: hypothetical protein VJI52_01140 [Candidatus Nanoarchaeia archaeon]|nr:hypothetical protein [Candidatus Nanoarchaeia archaeon]